MPVMFKDKGLKRIVKQAKALGDLVLTIGFQGQKGAQLYPTGVNVATVALYNEFGTRDIPARSFMRGALVADRVRIQEFIANTIGNVFAGTETALEAMRDIGRFIAGRIQERIDNSTQWAKANAPSTVKRKGFNRPLHETDRMARSITWAVRQGSVDGSIILQGSP